MALSAVERKAARDQIATIRRTLSIQGFVPTPGVARVAINSVCDGKAIVNILHVAMATPPTAELMTTAADTVADAWSTANLGFLAPSVSLGSVIATDASSQDGPSAVSNHVLGHVGGAAGPAMPRSVAVVINLHTAKAGRSHRGRIFIGGSTVENLGGSKDHQITPEAAATWTGQMQTFLATCKTAGHPVVIASRVTSPGTFEEVTTAIAALELGSQRRRLRP